MRRYLLGAVAAAVIASPATARDNTWYVGIEGGVMKVEELDLDYADAARDIENGLKVEHNYGFDADLIGGYDFGAFRAEAEVGFKRAGIEDVDYNAAFLPTGTAIFERNSNGRATAISSMANLLLDFGDDDGWSGYAGGGIGLARVKYTIDTPALDIGFRDTDDELAWQLIAGVRAAITPSVDVGLKYRFFRTTELDFGGDLGLPGGGPFDLNGKWRSHSLLASVIVNFVAPVAPVVVAPPPAPPPATQTCPDGSVILATDVCPAPPPPPPPPPPAGERG